MNPVFKEQSRSKYLKNLKAADQSQKALNSIIAQNIDTKNALLTTTTTKFAPIIKSLATIGDNTKVTADTSLSIFNTIKQLNEIFETYVNKLQQISDTSTALILREIETLTKERTDLTKKYEQTNIDTTEMLFSFEKKLTKINRRIDDLLDKMDNSEKIEDLRKINDAYKQKTDEIIKGLEHENNILKQRVIKRIEDFTVDEFESAIKETNDIVDLITFIKDNLPQTRLSSMENNVYNYVYNFNGTLKASSTLKNMPIKNLQDVLIQYKRDITSNEVAREVSFGAPTKGSGVDVATNLPVDKNMQLVNLLLASHRAGNTSGFQEFDSKLKSLLNKHMITENDYQNFKKSWRIST